MVSSKLEDRAVSSVVGSILIAGMVVVLIGVMAGPMFMTYLDDDSTPIAEFEIKYSDGNANILYANGNPLDADRVSVLENGTEVNGFSGTIRPGDNILVEDVDIDTEISVVWSHGGGSYDVLEREVISESDMENG